MSSKLKLTPIALLVLSLLSTPVVQAVGEASGSGATGAGGGSAGGGGVVGDAAGDIEEEEENDDEDEEEREPQQDTAGDALPAVPDANAGADAGAGAGAEGANGGDGGDGANGGDGGDAGAGADVDDGDGAEVDDGADGGDGDANAGSAGAGAGDANAGSAGAGAGAGGEVDAGGNRNEEHAQGDDPDVLAQDDAGGVMMDQPQNNGQPPQAGDNPVAQPAAPNDDQSQPATAAAKDKTVSGTSASITATTPENERAFNNLTITDKTMTVTDTPVTIKQALTIGGGQGSQDALFEVSGKNASVTVEKASTLSNSNPPADGTPRKPQLLIEKDGSISFKESLTATNSTVKVGSGAKMQLASQGMTLNGSTLMLDSGAQLSGLGETMAPVTISGNTTVDLSGGAVVKLEKITAQDGSSTTLLIKDGSQLQVGKTARLAPSDAGEAVAQPQAVAPPAMQLQAATILVDGKTSLLSTIGLSVGANSLITLSNGGTLKGETVKLTGANSQLRIGDKNAPGFLDPGSSVQFDETHGATQKLVFEHSQGNNTPYDFAAKILGNGTVESLKGTTRLLGQTIAGTTLVDGGSTLILQRAKLAATTIRAGTLILESGSLGNTTIGKAGLLSVGAQSAKVAGTFTMQAGGQLFVTLDDKSKPTTAAVSATGAATITDGRLTVHAKPGLQLKTPYTIVEGSSLTGKFGEFSIINDTPYLTGTLGYDQTKAFVTWAKTDSFSSVSTRPGAVSAGKSIDNLPADNPVYQHMVAQTPQTATQVLETLSGDSVASVASALQNVAVTGQSAQVPMRFLRQNLAATMRPGAPLAQSGGSMPISALPSSTEMPLWAEVVGNWQRDEGSSQAPGLRANTTGLYIGGDHAINRDWRLGAALGYTHTKVDVNSRDAHAHVDNYSLSLYGGRSWMTGANRLNLMAGTAYTWHEIDSRRNLAGADLQQTATARHGASTVQLFTELGYAMPLSNAINVEPYLGLSWNKQEMRGYTETGSIAALNVKAQENTTFTTTLGLRTRYQFDLAGKPAAVRASLGWRHLAGDLTPQSSVNFSGGQSFGVRGTTLARSNALLELGGDMRINDSSMLSLTYGGEFGAGTQQHQVSAVARWSF